MTLTFKAPITTAADDIHKYFFIVFFHRNFFIVFFSQKIRLDVSSESSAGQRIHMKKIKPYFLWKIKVNKSTASGAKYARSSVIFPHRMAFVGGG